MLHEELGWDCNAAMSCDVLCVCKGEMSGQTDLGGMCCLWRTSFARLVMKDLVLWLEMWSACYLSCVGGWS